MGVLGEIIVKLGWDQSFWWQLGILLFLFIVLKFVLFDKLLWVLDHREEKTSGLADEAQELNHQADKLEGEYKAKIDVARHNAKNFFREKREEWMEHERQEIHKAEGEISVDFDKKRTHLEEEFQQKRQAILNKTSELSDELVGKLVK